MFKHASVLRSWRIKPIAKQFRSLGCIAAHTAKCDVLQRCDVDVIDDVFPRTHGRPLRAEFTSAINAALVAFQYRFFNVFGYAPLVRHRLFRVGCSAVIASLKFYTLVAELHRGFGAL